MAHFLASASGSKSNQRVAHFLVDVYIMMKRYKMVKVYNPICVAVLMLIVCFLCGSIEVLATESDIQNEEIGRAVSNETIVYSEDLTSENTLDATENDELFSEFVNQVFGVSEDEKLEISNSKKMMTAKPSAGNRLSGMDAEIYKYIAGKLSEITSGRLKSTVFILDPADWTDINLGPYSAADLGVSSLYDENGGISQEYAEAYYKKVGFDISAIVSALMSDYPYEMFWYDKTEGSFCDNIAFNIYSFQDGTEALKMTSITFSMYVAKEYSANNTIKTTELNDVFVTVQTAANNARRIVDSYSDTNDYEKLIGYKSVICDWTDYNDNAADESANISYGNPWQLIWVFDGDAETNVVCEGYSKAFQYLCDMTSWKAAINCISITGNIKYPDAPKNTGHMWNVVAINGNNYLADVTNSDAGTIGEDNQLFLVGNMNGDANGYSFEIANKLYRYEYDDEAKALYRESERLLHNTNYDPEETVSREGLCQDDAGNWGYYTNGILDASVTGLFKDAATNKWYFINKGVHDPSFVGVAKNPNNGNWYFVKNGTYVNSFTGVAKSIANNKWYFVRDGQLDWKFTGFGKSVADGNWYFVKNGELDWTFTGFGKSAANDKWYFAKNGKLDWSFTGFGKSVANGKWYFAKNGALDWTFTGFGKSVANGKWYFARKGELDWSFTGVAKSVANGKWYYARKGELDWNYTGGAVSVANGKWYYVKKGELDWTYTGKAKGTDGVTRNYVKGVAR